MNGIDIGTLMRAADYLDSLAGLVPSRWVALAGHGREVAAELRRACAAAMQAEAIRQQERANPRT